MMRARLDYGSVAYMSAAKSHLKKLDVEQAEGLRIYSGHLRPLQLQLCKMEEEPLRIKKRGQGDIGVIGQKYIEQNYANRVVIFTDESKEPENGRTGAAVYIPEFKVAL